MPTKISVVYGEKWQHKAKQNTKVHEMKSDKRQGNPNRAKTHAEPSAEQ